MANRDVFSKVLPNIKLSTVLDSEGREIQVERREDAEQNAKQQEIYDILVAAGYFRARIKGLSAFDKIVGGMTWCIEASDFDVDVDLLFHENLSIGQKIALTEKIVTVLPKMQCPCLIEPHQIQGLDFIKIFPVIQWLVKRSVENRTERAEKLKRFATSQFQNNFQFECDVKSRDMYANSSQFVKQILSLDAPKRQYKRKEAGPDDEKTRVRITLLEYGNKSLIGPSFGIAAMKKSESDAVVEDELAAEIDVAQLLKNLYVANEDECLNHSDLTENEKNALTKHYSDLRSEMSADVKQLSERSQIKNLETTKLALERKLQKIQEDNRAMEKRLAEEKHSVDLTISEEKDIKAEIRSFESQDQKSDKGILENIQKLVIKNEELKQKEVAFKDQCRQEMARIQREIKEAERVTPEEDVRESMHLLEIEREKLQTVRLQLAKKNRAIVSIQRQLDNIPSRTELSQYQRRFLELYNQVSAKHRETKQFYTMYNTLDDTKRYLTKELSLLNSIHENYNDGMANQQLKDQFVTQLETIVDGVKQTKIKVKNKYEDEKAKRDGLNSQLMCLIEQQRKYATFVKQFTIECQRNETMIQQLKALQKNLLVPGVGILCYDCTQRISNNACAACAKQCQIVEIGSDMPQSLKTYFEPPLTKLEKIQQQFRFLQQQQEIALKLKKTVEESEKKKASQIKKILDMEQKVKARGQQLQMVIRSKLEYYRNLKEKNQKLEIEEARLLKYFKENGYPVDKNVSADSGVHSFEKSVKHIDKKKEIEFLEREKWQRQFEEEQKRKLLERAEAERRQKQEIQENKIRRVQLKESCEFFGDYQKHINEIDVTIEKEKEWERYMRCNGLPNAYDPGDLRKYMHMWKLQNENLNKLEINWLLNIDERTILTQDQSKIDLTRNNLKAKQPILGDSYSKRIREILGILTEIDEAINSGLSRAIIKDLHVLKLTFRTAIAEYIDDFTYKILSNIERDMELSKGGVVATHAYQSDIFKSQIWTLREVPQPQLNPKEKLKFERAHTEIEFPLLELEIALPPSIKCKDSGIRVLWLSYDHFSDYSPSYEIPFKVDTTIDIGMATRKEWRKRKEIIKEAKENADDGKSKKNDGIIDVRKIYTEYEGELSKEVRRRKGLEGLKLKEFDVNLRKYRMVGGIYCIEYVKQPQQDMKLNSKKYLRTVFYPNSLQRKHFHQTYKPPAPVLPGVRRLPEEIEAEMREMEANLDKLASATIKLPEDTIMWFGPPTVCRWEWPAETNYSERKKNKTKSKSKFKHKSAKHPKIIEDFNLFNIPSGLDMYCIMQEFVVPRLPNGYTIKIDKVVGDRRRSSLLRSTRKDSKEPASANITTRPSSDNIKYALVETNSPRPLFPKVTIKRELNVVEKIDRSASIVTDDCSNNDNDNYSERSSDSIKKVYMFSKLLKDLDELNELQYPYPEKQIEEISESLSVSVEEEEVETEPDFSISFLRTNDFPWNKKPDKSDEQPPEEESEDSSIVEDADMETDSSSDDEDQNIGRWSTRDVHDAKFNEDKLAIQFKIWRLGCFGLAINWYSNLPFQTWELKPDIKSTVPNTIIFSLPASVVSIELTVSDKGIILNSFQGGVSTIIQDVIDTTMSFQELKNIFTSAGVNLFPEDDAFCYAEGTCEKHYVMESHLYDCMAAIALTHNFTWSRWNFMSGRRSCVLLIREIVENRKTPTHSTLQVTPLKATIIDCTDVSPCFNPVGIEGMEFYADLHQLSKAHSQTVSLMKQSQMNTLLRNNVKLILTATRPLSFC